MSVSLNLETDEIRPVSELCRRLTGRRPAPATVWRWVREGRHGVRLDAVHIQGHWQTSAAVFADFLRATSAAARREAPPAADAAVERDEATARRLKRAGLL
jgi:hypothetical protein